MAQGHDNADKRCLRIAAAGDLHFSEHRRDEARRSIESLPGSADLVLLAGDLTTHGEPEQAAVLAEACAPLDVPVFAVMGNHDWHANRRDEFVEVLASGGSACSIADWARLRGERTRGRDRRPQGFRGRLPGLGLPDFGEPSLRSVYRETTREVEALDQGLREIALCPTRIVLLHYAPTKATIVGEPPGIWAFLGTDRLAAPIAEHEPDLVLHGHAHAGTFEGAIGLSPGLQRVRARDGSRLLAVRARRLGPLRTPIH